ncbi:MAG: hypothetical protein LJE84_06570 [Gammaproteobacteria bacterium]|nr:hypothetical protein [Gammaproteobacteria bacterium]
MTSVELLNWVRGPGLQIAFFLFVFGLVVRFLEMFLLGRKTDLSPARGSAFRGALRTIYSRSLLPPGEMSRREAFVHVAGWTFHLGFLLTLFFYGPHIVLFEDLLGLSWPALPNGIIDILAIAAIVALVALLINRFTDPVRRMLGGLNDYVAWTATFLPLATGFLAVKRLFLPYNDMLMLHILSVELLLILLPFTKLIHAVTFLVSRGYNGAIAGHKGVQA